METVSNLMWSLKEILVKEFFFNIYLSVKQDHIFRSVVFILKSPWPGKL